MICGAPAPSYAGRPVVSWSRSSYLLGHASVQTTERYLGTRQDLLHAPNDAIKLKLS